MANRIEGDLISRKALLSALPRFEKDQVGYPLNGGISYAKIQINAAQSVDAVEVLHGHWCWEGRFKACSECGSYVEWDETLGANFWKFCPYCGAKMDGDNHENP